MKDTLIIWSLKKNSTEWILISSEIVGRVITNNYFYVEKSCTSFDYRDSGGETLIGDKETIARRTTKSDGEVDYFSSSWRFVQERGIGNG